jgi:DNA topoisomerase-1
VKSTARPGDGLQFRYARLLAPRHQRSQTQRGALLRICDVTEPNLTESHAQAAKEAGLRYVTDASPGLRRRPRGKNFAYEQSDGSRVTDRDVLARIKSLVIPPAWRDVWIAPQATAHLQATGRDARGRKQYRYHPRFRESRDATKFERMLDFGRKLPLIRRRVKRDLALPGVPRERVLAGVVRLLERTLIRVGNDEYARTNGSYGLTTMRNRHASVNGSKVSFEFRGKSGICHAIDINDPAIARLVRKCQDLPGQQLFTFTDETGDTAHVGSEDVNEYLRVIADDEFSAKDFRTWAGTVMTLSALGRLDDFASEAEAKRNVATAIAAVARVMGNTPAVCRKCYVHPLVVDAYLNRSLARSNGTPPSRHLRVSEAAVLALLRGRGTKRASMKPRSDQPLDGQGRN